MSLQITNDQYKEAANKLGWDVAAIKAVAQVESLSGGFLKDGTPKTLFEGHIFHRETKGRFSKEHPTLSYPKWTKKYYGSQANEKIILDTAVKLDRQAALKSTSWGAFQIMGFNYKHCGFNTVQEFVNAMYKSEYSQLLAFVNYIESVGISKHVINKDWASFARAYNGPGYKANNYDVKLASAYKKYSNEN